MKTSPQLETSPVKELVRAGHEFAAEMGADTPLIEIAKLVSRLATELDVQLSRANTLASLAAEPVAWTDADELRDANNGGSGYLFAIGCDANKFADPRRQVMLYAAPPAPLVPEGIPKGLAGHIVSLLAHNIGDKLLAQKIWNACRTAMLLSISQTENGK